MYSVHKPFLPIGQLHRGIHHPHLRTQRKVPGLGQDIGIITGFHLFVCFLWVTGSAHWGDALCTRDFCPQTLTYTEDDKFLDAICLVLIKHNTEITKQQHRGVANEVRIGVMPNMVSEHCQLEWQCQTPRQIKTSPLARQKPQQFKTKTFLRTHS